MFGFIKNLIRPKSCKEVKQEYKQAKVNWIARVDDCKESEEILKSQLQISEIEGNILDMCYGGLRPNQEDCPTLIVYNYKKLLEIANEEALVRVTNYLGMYLSEQQQQDFMNKVSQLKEYKEWKLKKRINKLMEDF